MGYPLTVCKGVIPKYAQIYDFKDDDNMSTSSTRFSTKSTSNKHLNILCNDRIKMNKDMNDFMSVVKGYYAPVEPDTSMNKENIINSVDKSNI